MTRRDCLNGAAAAVFATLPFPAHARQLIDVRSLGARGDGTTLDTDAINRAIAEAGRGGGGTVVVPPGRYLCFSVRLMSQVTLVLQQGAVIEAADPARHSGRYDEPEDRGEQLFQDFGHSHWRNSLIWGDGLTDIAIVGPGRIEGTGLTRNGPGSRWRRQAGERPMSMRGMTEAQVAQLEPDEAAMRGIGNKAIALRNCSRVRIADLVIHKGGHFAILLTGCRSVALERLRIDTQRDGIDLDGVQDARVEDCRVNSPNDDAIVVKSSYALGRPFPSEDVVIRGCTVSGFDLGTMLDGTRRTTLKLAPDRDRPTGRIKLGTESNGGYARVLIEKCRFEHSRGLALETVDGGNMTDIVARNLTLTDVTTAPFFVRLGDRRRGPEGTGIAAVRDVRISDVEATGIDGRYPAMLAGLPGHPLRNVTLERVHLAFDGGGTLADVARRPEELAEAYPEPSMFGVLPAWGLWTRHVDGLSLDRVTMETRAPEARPAIITSDTHDVRAKATPRWAGRVTLD